MGSWGVGIYENDISLDVKNQFEKLLSNGKSVEEITAKLIEDFESLTGDPWEEPLFWFALADTQWKLGDAFAYQLESELAKEKGLFGRYFLIQKVDEGNWYPGHKYWFVSNTHGQTFAELYPDSEEDYCFWRDQGVVFMRNYDYINDVVNRLSV